MGAKASPLCASAAGTRWPWRLKDEVLSERSVVSIQPTKQLQASRKNPDPFGKLWAGSSPSAQTPRKRLKLQVQSSGRGKTVRVFREKKRPGKSQGRDTLKFQAGPRIYKRVPAHSS